MSPQEPRHEHGRELPDRPNLRYHVIKASSERKKQSLLLRLIEKQAGCGIIYAATVKTVDALADFLWSQGVECGRYHGRMHAKDRERVQSAFMDDGEPRLDELQRRDEIGDVEQLAAEHVPHDHVRGVRIR